MQVKNEKNGTLLTKILLLIALALAVFVVVEVFYVSKKSPDTIKATAEKMTVNNITISSVLSKSHLEPIVTFLTNAIQNAYISPEITFAEDNNAKIPTYIATWEKNSKKISLMVWLTLDKKNVSYIRVWTLSPMEKLDDIVSSKLISDLANEKFIQNIGKLECTQAPSKNDQKTKLTECSSMTTLSDGNSVGTTVRSPIEYKSSTVGVMGIEKKTASSLCFIPKEGKKLYPNNTCL